AFSAEARTVLCGGITLFLIGVSTLQWASQNSLPGRAILVRSLLAGLSLCLIPVGSGLSPMIIVLLLSMSLIALNRFDGIALLTE
ncbi:MAG: low temperature requirement protein A, partial [Cyanobacteria bacterium P01_G01_bin.38]